MPMEKGDLDGLIQFFIIKKSPKIAWKNRKSIKEYHL